MEKKRFFRLNTLWKRKILPETAKPLDLFTCNRVCTNFNGRARKYATVGMFSHIDMQMLFFISHNLSDSYPKSWLIFGRLFLHRSRLFLCWYVPTACWRFQSALRWITEWWSLPNIWLHDRSNAFLYCIIQLWLLVSCADRITQHEEYLIVPCHTFVLLDYL